MLVPSSLENIGLYSSKGFSALKNVDYCKVILGKGTPFGGEGFLDKLRLCWVKFCVLNWINFELSKVSSKID